MSLIIVGASGYIGKKLYISSKSVSNTYGTSSRGTNGLLRFKLEKYSDFDYGPIGQADVVFLSAAISAPDICATEYERSWAVNVTSTSEFIDKVTSRGARVVFFSSDAVYGGCSEVVDETSSSNATGEYAEMKDAVERRFLGNPLFKSIRLSYVFSREDKFTRYLSACAERGEVAELFHPFCRAIVHRDDVVAGALALAQRWDEFPQKVINFGGPEVLSRIDFADCLKLTVLPNLKYRVTEPESDFFKNRPRIIAMSSNVLPNLLGRCSTRLIDAVKIEFKSL